MITFTCNAAGIPTPAVTWYLNGTQPHIGGVISEPIPDTSVGERIPAAAASVTFEVRCTLITGQQITLVQTTLTVQGKT